MIPSGNLAINLHVTDAADWLARRDSDPHLWATVEYLLEHGRSDEAVACLEDHIERTAYVRWLVLNRNKNGKTEETEETENTEHPIEYQQWFDGQTDLDRSREAS